MNSAVALAFHLIEIRSLTMQHCLYCKSISSNFLLAVTGRYVVLYEIPVQYKFQSLYHSSTVNRQIQSSIMMVM